MKKLLFLTIVLISVNTTFGSVTAIIPRLKATEIFLPVGKNGQLISISELSQISVRDFEILTAKKLKFSDKLGFKLAQHKLKKSINPDGTFNSKKLERYIKRGGETGFHAGGFFLGFLVGLIGVIIAYFIKDDYKRNRVKWAWIGWGVWLLIWLTLLLSGAFEGLYYY